MSQTPGESDLPTLLRTMEPRLHPGPFCFCSVDEATYARLAALPTGMFREPEGVTLILPTAEADRAGLSYAERWACITMMVHSALSAVGFLAAISAALSAAGISTNAVAGYYHDHLFVQWDRREQAVAALRELAARS